MALPSRGQAKDLKEEFPDLSGFSRSNLSYAKQFYKFYQTPIVQQPVGQLQPPDTIIQQLATKIPCRNKQFLLLAPTLR